jgi:hypothetical protein
LALRLGDLLRAVIGEFDQYDCKPTKLQTAVIGTSF